ncbi:OmpA/MotB domain protein [[Leptolyngbya] sp. PCC 7376]|uniref:OmpA family protein n=1 Tax=[Leptolyngbya] sp. PCC 7376 TaxID=111781 RepID=UPI00029F31CC|nr:OmpA family protein [[Leptolyngbya] sp. PCC 7376]AFY36662.1 OmpA/MotB domain protein [[Leptolyngbya] sp. PCC 7376]
MEQNSEGLHPAKRPESNGDRPVANPTDASNPSQAVAANIVSSNDPQQQNPPDENVLQELLANLVFTSSQHPDFTPLEQKIKQIEHQLYDPEEVIKLLMPIISELLNRKVMESKDSIVRAIVPIIDEVIVEKTGEDKVAMIRAIANLIPGAIDQQVRSNSDDLVEALAPAMGEIIKQQIRIERDAMVDALYPVIGSTISKYMQEVVQEINSRVESTLTPAGIRRKVQAKIQGVSEAELIFQESMPFQIQAIFLIHKQSGLIIASAKQEKEADKQESSLEGDLMAGMLTAMRSFASECAIEPGNTSELKEIEYESFQILMEVAGYCYMATVIKGNIEQAYIENMRQSLANIILNYDRDQSIHYYSGDPSSVDDAVQEELDNLILYAPKTDKVGKKGWPIALLLLIFIPLLAWGGWRTWQDKQLKALAAIESKIDLELDVDPQLAVYPVESVAQKVKGDRQIILSGKVPSARLKEKAKAITDKQLTLLAEPSEWQVINEIITVEVEPATEVTIAEVVRLTDVFNQNENTIITTEYSDRQVTVSGHLRTEVQLQQIADGFSQIPGVDNVLIASTAKAFPIDQRLYFGTNAKAINPKDAQEKLPSIQEFLQQYPDMKLRIIGHIHPSETEQKASLAEQRAIAVRDSLLGLGIAEARLEIVAAPSAPPNLTQADDSWLSRCVRFERIMEQ